MKTVPWSAHEEKWTRRSIIFDWLAFWLLFALMAVLFSQQLYLGGAIPFFTLGFFLGDLLHQREKLDAMLLNKPRSMSGLTHWVQLRPWQTEMCCACGAQIRIADAHWYPNPVDAGGGRFSIVCSCGIGYFKLKA